MIGKNFPLAETKKFASFLIHVLILSLCLIVLGKNSKAQSFRFRNYTVTDGLPQSTVNSITQDQNGNLWLGTEGGLSQFDGFLFRSFSNNDGLTESSVRAIKHDKLGRIWVGTSSGKIYVWEGATFTEFKLPIGPEQAKKIIQIVENTNGDMWFSTEGAGAIRILFNKQTHLSKVEYFSIAQKLSDLVFHILPLSEKKILFLTDIGMKIYDQEKKSIEFFAQKILPVYNYTCALKDNEGNLWLGTFDKGLCKYNESKGSVIFYDVSKGLPGNFINTIFQDSKGAIWVSCWKEGLVCIKDGEFKKYNTDNGLPGNKVWCIFEDDEKNMWFGMQDKGICSFRGNLFNHYGMNQGLGNEIVNAICQDRQGSIWLATNEEITWISKNAKTNNNTTGQINLGEYFASNLVTCFTSGSDGLIYAGVFSGGIAAIDPIRKMVVRGFAIKQNLINSIAFDKSGKLWIGANNGLTLVETSGEPDKTHRFNTDKFADMHIMCIYPASDGSIWLGTRGNYVYKIKNNNIEHFDASKGLLHANATSITADSLGHIWIGTEGGGMYCYDKNKFIPKHQNDKLVPNYITSLTFTKNGLWVGSNNGICLITKNKIHHFGKHEGFTEMETRTNAALNDNKGNVWFGTNSGACAIDYSAFILNKVPPKICFTSFKIFGDEYRYEQNKTFSYKQNEIIFSFKATSLTVPEKVSFYYRLESEGYREEWKKTDKEQQAIYTNLAPGHYQFHLKASNNNGIFTPKELSYSFVIEAPFWQTYTFYIIIIVLSSGGIFGFMRIRTRKLRKDKEYLEGVVKQRTKEIEDKNNELEDANKKIFYKNKEITDSIRYAKNIQEAILPSPIAFSKHFPKGFVFYRPKDIVSGDFYWLSDVTNVEEKNLSNLEFGGIIEKQKEQPVEREENVPDHTFEESQLMFAVADCTGHGVPGAFMCMVGHSLLNQIVNLEKVMSPGRVIDLLDLGVQLMLKQKETENRDGMDIAMVFIDRQHKILRFSGALRPMLFFRKTNSFGDPITDYKLEVITPDKFGVGGRASENPPHTTIELNYQPGDTFYLFSDGVCDQFGGPFGKKLMTNKFKEFVHSVQNLNMDMQYARLESFFDQWKGQNDQVDDVLVVGIKL
ncbi:MAG: two-component regulator propeller domain-containing protein [Bacteroidota bacterium]